MSLQLLTNPNVGLQPEPKTTKRTFDTLTTHFAYLGSKSKGRNLPKKSGGMEEEFVGEYQTLMEQEMFDFVLFEVSKRTMSFGNN